MEIQTNGPPFHEASSCPEPNVLPLGVPFLFYFALCMCVYSRKQKIIKKLYLVPKNLTFARFGGGD